MLKQKNQQQHMGENEPSVNTNKDIRLLKQIIRTLEEKSLKEKNVYQKQVQKKRQEIEVLRDQLNEQRIVETTLRNELRVISNELKIMKQK